MCPIAPAENTRIVRGDNRAEYDSEQIGAILDSAFVCQVGFTIDGQAHIIPTAYVRIGDAIYLHGHLQNQMINALLDGQTACLSVTLLDGLVLARSGFKHSVNYRSITLFGKAERVPEEEKAASLDALVNHLVPGRAGEIRPYTPQELNATLVVKIPIDEAAAKVRTGPPLDKEPDYDTDIWAGVVNIETKFGAIEPCPELDESVPVPEHVQQLVAREKLY